MYLYTYLEYLIGMVPKQLCLLHARVGDSIAVGRFLEPSDEIADPGCCCFLPRWHSWAFWAHQEWVLEICWARFQFFSFNTFYVSQIFRKRDVQASCTMESNCTIYICLNVLWYLLNKYNYITFTSLWR